MITRLCTQTAVYWGSPVKDGYGGMTYADPVEILCRWENTLKVIQSSDGENIVSQAQVFVLEDLDEQGMIALASLDDLDSAPDPKDSGAYTIKQIRKFPALGSTSEFVRTVYLGW